MSAPRVPAGLRILAVDDEPGLTEVVVRMLRPDGHTVTTARSGEQALEKLTEAPFDIVISDLAMGLGMSGWDLAGEVRAHWPSVRFILMSGWGTIIDPEEAHARGAESVLSKPFSYSELLLNLSAPVDEGGLPA